MQIESCPFVFGPPDDLVLKVFSQVVEVIAVTGNPHNEVTVFFGEFLGIFQGCSGDHIKLDMMAVHAEVRPDEVAQFCNAVFTIEEGRREFLI